MKRNNSFELIVQKSLAGTGICDNLMSREAIVLERIARGGGATNWYYCKDTAALDEIEKKLSPGSVVSFYFDNRLEKSLYSERVIGRIEKVIKSAGECVVGKLCEDSITINVEFITAYSELADFVVDIPVSSWLLFGEFPAWDNDGRNAITIALPDADGIIRSHPH